MIRFICLLVAPLFLMGTPQETIQLKANFTPGESRRMTFTNTQEVYLGEAMESRTTEESRCKITCLRNDDKLILSYVSSSMGDKSEKYKGLSKVQLAAAKAIDKRIERIRLDVQVNPETMEAEKVINMPDVLKQVGEVFSTAVNYVPESEGTWEERAEAVELVKAMLLVGAAVIEKEALWAVDVMLQYYNFEYVLGEEVTYEATGMDESTFGLFSGIEFPLTMDIRSRINESKDLSGDISSYYEKQAFADACNQVLPAENGLTYDADEVSGFEREQLVANLTTGWIKSIETSIQMIVREYTIISEQRVILR